MASDLVVALGRSAVGGTTLFGTNHYARQDRRQRLHVVPGGNHPLDESVCATCVRLPQSRQTYSVLGCQSGEQWGFTRGVNEHHVAVGVTSWHSRLPAAETGLTGTDLVRVTLERSHSALQAVDTLTDLIARHGQCAERGAKADAANDGIFLIADGQEAFVLEAAGKYWALMECRQVRAVTDVALIRQDWRRLSPGLAGLAIERGWWQDGGSKLDFAGCLDAQAPSHAPARRRWGRATLALEQQNGAIDAHFLRRMLFDLYDQTAAQKTHRPPAALAGGFLTALTGPGDPVLAWCSFGLPRVAVYFPVWLDGELPAALCQASSDGIDAWQQTQELLSFSEGTDAERGRVSEALERLQAVFDLDAETFLPEARRLKRAGDWNRLRTQATALMQKHLHLFAKEWRQLQGDEVAAEAVSVTEDFVSYSF